MLTLTSRTRFTWNEWPKSSWWSWGGCKGGSSRTTSPTLAPHFRRTICWSWRTTSTGFGPSYGLSLWGILYRRYNSLVTQAHGMHLARIADGGGQKVAPPLTKNLFA